MGVVVQFDYALWVSTFPEFSGTTPQQAQLYFDLATTILRNDGGGPVNNAQQQTMLLNLLTAHIAALFAPPSAGGSSSGVVGRINSATEGTVTLQAAYSNNVSEQMAWFIQTRYGAMYWAATVQYRTARYVPNLRNRGVVGPPGFGV